MDKVKFSIIVPVYNVELYLKECIESILIQNYKNIELILVDDGSNDASNSICKYYAELYDNIIFVQQLNQGVSAARNIGLVKSRGDYLLFVDSDDWLKYCCLARLYDTIIRNGFPDIVQCGYSVQSEFLKEIYPSEGNYNCIKDYQDSGNYVNSVFSYCIKKRIITENDIFFPVGIKYAEDLEFILKVFFRSKHIVCISDILYYYRVRPQSAMTIKPTYSSAIDNLKVAEHLFELLSSNTDGNVDFVKLRSTKIVNAFFVRLSMCKINLKILSDSTKEYRNFYNKYKIFDSLHHFLYRITNISTLFIIIYLKCCWKNKL